VIRHTWTVDDPDMVHPRHTYQTKPSRGLAEDAAWDVWRGAYKGLTLEESHLRQGTDGPWELLAPGASTPRLPMPDCAAT